MTLCHFLVTLRRGTGRIDDIIRLDVHDSSTHREVVGLVGHAELGFLNLVNRSHLVAINGPAWRRRQPSLSVRLERYLGASVHIPPFQSVRFRNIRANNQRSGTEKGQRHS